jgi:hypothetical protein
MENLTGRQWLTPVILATWEAEIGLMAVTGQARQTVQEIPSPKYPEQNALEVWLLDSLLLCKHEALSSKPSPTKKKKGNYTNRPNSALIAH